MNSSDKQKPPSKTPTVDLSFYNRTGLALKPSSYLCDRSGIVTRFDLINLALGIDAPNILCPHDRKHVSRWANRILKWTPAMIDRFLMVMNIDPTQFSDTRKHEMAKNMAMLHLDKIRNQRIVNVGTVIQGRRHYE